MELSDKAPASVNSESQSTPYTKSLLSQFVKSRNTHSSKGRQMFTVIKSRREIEETIKLMENRLNYIQHEIQASQKSQKKESQQSVKATNARKINTELAQMTKESNQRIQEEIEAKRERIRKERTQRQQRINEAKSLILIKNKESGLEVKKSKLENEKYIETCLENANADRKKLVKLASQRSQLSIRGMTSSKNMRRQSLEQDFNQRMNTEISLKGNAEEYLKQLEDLESSFMDQLKNTSQKSFKKLKKSSPVKARKKYYS